MYNSIGIVLKDGKVITTDATGVEWHEKSRTITLIKKRDVIARINMDNVIGWIDIDAYKAESEDKE